MEPLGLRVRGSCPDTRYELVRRYTMSYDRPSKDPVLIPRPHNPSIGRLQVTVSLSVVSLTLPLDP